MAAQELRWLTYLLTDLGEQPRSPPVLYVDNKATIALCQEHRLEHRTKHIALRYFLARELQQRGQLRLAYVATRANTADIFTKALPPCDHQRFSTVLGLVEGSDASKPASGAGKDGAHQEKREEVNAAAMADVDDEDDGYLSDDLEERYEAAANGEVAQRVRFAITLLVPVEFKAEVMRVQATLHALFGFWKKDLGLDVQSTTKFQELNTMYLNKKLYCRLQVSFDHARDANFVWRHGIVHNCMDGKTRINLDW
ncbi:unnamed protein product [Closterium sp. NIES-54]